MATILPAGILEVENRVYGDTAGFEVCGVDICGFKGRQMGVVFFYDGWCRILKERDNFFHNLVSPFEVGGRRITFANAHPADTFETIAIKGHLAVGQVLIGREVADFEFCMGMDVLGSSEDHHIANKAASDIRVARVI